MGTDAVLTCTISHAHPPVTDLTIQPETGPNWHMTRNGNESVSLVFKKATTVNTGQFTCVAINNLTSATLTYKSYFGGKLMIIVERGGERGRGERGGEREGSRG